jgi:hypothetical protein
MATATVYIAAADLQLTGSYQELGDVLYLSTTTDDKSAAAQETPEGHAVRLDADGYITHITAINATRLLDRDGELVATLRDGRLLRLTRADVADVMDGSPLG